jgi:uncharacterized membrane protein
MIQGHVIDSWTQVEDRSRDAFHWIIFAGGIGGAPIFLFLAGVALVLAAGSRTRRGLLPREAAALARRRGWQILALAFLFRLQSWAISGGTLRTLLKVDILNVLGVSMVAGAFLLNGSRPRWQRALVFGAAATAVAMVTPILRTSGWVALLPDPVEWYVRPAPGATTFTLFPWAGFLLAGCAAGVWLDVADRLQEHRANIALALVGAALAAGGYLTSFLPSIYAESSFWTSSPTFFLVRTGLVLMLAAGAYAWNLVIRRYSPMRDLGRSSLFVYWIHVEMAYGVLSAPLHRGLSLEYAYAGFILLSVVLFAIVRIKDRLKTDAVPQFTRRSEQAHVSSSGTW